MKKSTVFAFSFALFAVIAGQFVKGNGTEKVLQALLLGSIGGGMTTGIYSLAKSSEEETETDQNSITPTNNSVTNYNTRRGVVATQYGNTRTDNTVYTEISEPIAMIDSDYATDYTPVYEREEVLPIPDQNSSEYSYPSSDNQTPEPNQSEPTPSYTPEPAPQTPSYSAPEPTPDPTPTQTYTPDTSYYEPPSYSVPDSSPSYPIDSSPSPSSYD